MRIKTKSILCILLTLVICLISATPALAQNKTYMEAEESVTIWTTAPGVSFYVECYGDYDFIKFTQIADSFTCSFDEWAGDTAWFTIDAVQEGCSVLELDLVDKKGGIADHMEVTVCVASPYVMFSTNRVNIVYGGTNSCTVTCIVDGYLPEGSTLHYDKTNSLIEAQWGEWYYANGYSFCDLTLSSLGKATSDYIKISLLDNNGYSLCEDDIQVFVMQHFEVGQPFAGDVDNDFSITVSDARLCLRAAIGLEKYTPDSREYWQCDFDEDEFITVADARLILRQAIGIFDTPLFGYLSIVSNEFYGDTAEIRQYVLKDIDGNGYKELIVKTTSDGGYCYNFYTVDCYGFITWCGGGLENSSLYERDGRLYAVKQNGSSLEVSELALTPDMLLTKTKVSSADFSAKPGAPLEMHSVSNLEPFGIYGE